MQLSLQLSKLQGTTSYFDGNMGRVGVKSDTMVNISCRERVFWPTKGTGGLQHHIFFIFDGKQHPNNNWFRGC